MTQRPLTVDRLLGLFGTALAVVALLGSLGLLLSGLLLAAALILLAIALPGILENRVPAFEYSRMVYDYAILDETGKDVKIQCSSLLRIRKKEVRTGGYSWSAEPHGVRSWLRYESRQEPGSGERIELPLRGPQKAGGMYEWNYSYDPPLTRGQKVWVIQEFKVSNEFVQGTCSDFFVASRPIREFVWIVRFPPGRPAKRWWASADFLPGKPDLRLLEESHTRTAEIRWKTNSMKRGARYHLNWEW